jgi:glutathione-independent formaldehyde dehydrogenase
VILKIVATNICGSDQHMVRGRTTAPAGLILGQEITGEVIEAGPDVEFIKKSDLVSVPFNIACGRCRMCKEGNTGVCLNVNPGGYGSAYGYVDMGGWVGGQAEYVMVPYADWNVLKFLEKEQALEKILDLTMLSDIFPTGYHGCVSAGVTTGSTVYIAGAGPVALAAAHAAQLLGAGVVIVGDMNSQRLEQARSFGCETVDLHPGRVAARPDRAARRRADGRRRRRRRLRGQGPWPRRRRGAGHRAELDHGDHPRGRQARYPRPARDRRSSREGRGRPARQPRDPHRPRLAKSHSFTTGQCPVMRYHRLMNAILNDRCQIAKVVNATVISLDEAPEGYQAFDKGASRQYVLDLHGCSATSTASPHKTTGHVGSPEAARSLR